MSTVVGNGAAGPMEEVHIMVVVASGVIDDPDLSMCEGEIVGSSIDGDEDDKKIGDHLVGGSLHTVSTPAYEGRLAEEMICFEGTRSLYQRAWPRRRVYGMNIYLFFNKSIIRF